MKLVVCRFFLLATVISLAACGSNPTRPDGTNGADIGSSSTDLGSGATATGVTINDAGEGQPVDPNSIAGRAPLERVIYFDYDTAEIRPEYLDIVAQHGRFLAQNSGGKVRLEGHTDERGSPEYNIALGEARAKSIGRLLELQGVGEQQMQAISYGEELPVDEGRNTEAWAKNRRVNIIYEADIPN